MDSSRLIIVTLLCVLWGILTPAYDASLTYELGDSALDTIADTIAEKTFISSGALTKVDCDENNLTKCHNTSVMLENVKNPYVGGNLIVIQDNGCTITTVFEMANCDSDSQKSCPKMGATNGHCYVACLGLYSCTVVFVK